LLCRIRFCYIKPTYFHYMHCWCPGVKELILRDPICARIVTLMNAYGWKLRVLVTCVLFYPMVDSV